MLSILFLHNEKFTLERHNVLITINNQRRLYDVVVTNQRLLIYLNDNDYDMISSSFSVAHGQNNNFFKDCFKEIRIDSIIKKEGNCIYLNSEVLEIYDEQILNCLC